MEIRKETKNTIIKWCGEIGIAINADEVKNYKRFLALDGLDSTAQADRLAVAVMNIAADSGALAYIPAELKQQEIRTAFTTEISYKAILSDNLRQLRALVSSERLNYCEVFDRQRGKYYFCYLPDELAALKAKKEQQEKEADENASRINSEIEAARKEIRALEDKARQLDAELFRIASKRSSCTDAVRLLNNFRR